MIVRGSGDRTPLAPRSRFIWTKHHTSVGEPDRLDDVHRARPRARAIHLSGALGDGVEQLLHVLTRMDLRFESVQRVLGMTEFTGD